MLNNRKEHTLASLGIVYSDIPGIHNHASFFLKRFLPFEHLQYLTLYTFHFAVGQLFNHLKKTNKPRDSFRFHLVKTSCSESI